MLEGSGGDGTETGRNQGLRRGAFSAVSARVPPRCRNSNIGLDAIYATSLHGSLRLDALSIGPRIDIATASVSKSLETSGYRNLFLFFFLLFSFCFLAFFSFLSFFALNLTRSYSVHANRFKSNSIEAPDHLPIARGKGRRSEVKRALPEVVSP